MTVTALIGGMTTPSYPQNDKKYAIAPQVKEI